MPFKPELMNACEFEEFAHINEHLIDFHVIKSPGNRLSDNGKRHAWRRSLLYSPCSSIFTFIRCNLTVSFYFIARFFRVDYRMHFYIICVNSFLSWWSILWQMKPIVAYIYKMYNNCYKDSITIIWFLRRR